MKPTQTMLVTGGAIGIGRATAQAFARSGYHVVVTDVLQNEGESLVSQLCAQGHSAEFLPLDVRSTPHADQVAASVDRRHGPIDVLVLNAGVALKVPIANMTDEMWDLTFDIDLKGMFRVVRATLPAMRVKQSGSIICLTSLMGLAYGWGEHVHYSAAKAGVIGLVRGLAVELAPEGIRVNGVAPGYIQTAQLLSEEHSMGRKGMEEAASYIPMRRIGQPEDIADVILFLASDAARYMTGQILVVDGGLLVGRN